MPGPRTSLVGREDELAAVRRALADARSGRSAVVVVEGEAGIGKTRLLEEAVAAETGIAVLQPVPDELSWSRPFGALADALGVRATAADADRRALDRLLRGGGAVGIDALNESPNTRHEAVERFVTILESMAGEQPLALVLDDLHLAEPSTALVLPSLVRRLAGLPVAVVVALRPAPMSADLHRSLRQLDALGAVRVPIGGLTATAVRDLVAERLGREPTASLLGQIDGSEGNPLFVLELVDGLLTDDASDAPPDDGGDLPRSFRAIVDRRLRGLPDDTVSALWAASLLGATFSLDDLAVVIGSPPLDVLQRLRPAIDDGLVQEREGQLGFRHGLVGDAIHQQLPEGVRRTLHRQVGRALLASGRPAVLAARHLALGAEAGDLDAVRTLHTAATDASASAPALAVELLERALELLGPSDHLDDEVDLDDGTAELDVALTCDLLLALVWAGRPADAERRGRALLAAIGDRAPVAAHLGLARALLLQGQVAGCVLELESAAAAADAASPGDGARLLVEASLGRLLVGDVTRAAEHARTALDHGERTGDVPTTSGALTGLAWAELVGGDYEAAVDLTARAVAVADAGESSDLRHPWLFHGIALTSSDRLDEATDVLLDGRRRAGSTGTTWSLPLYHVALAQRHFACGAWDDCVAEADAAIAQAEELGARVGVVWPMAMRALVAVPRDQLAVAEESLARAEAELAVVGPQFGDAWTACARAMLLEAEQQPAAALEVLAPVWRRGRILGMVSELQLTGPVIVRLALASGEAALAEEVTADVEAVAAKAGTAGFRGNAGRCRGLVADDPDVLTGAADVLLATQRADRWVAAAEAAVALARHGRADEAAPYIDAAFGGFAQLDAVRLAAVADAELRAAGIRRGRRGSRQRPTSGWASLTDTERNVVRLAPEGLTNAGIAERLYISRRTVETHLSHVFAKLGIESRRALLTGEAGGAPR